MAKQRKGGRKSRSVDDASIIRWAKSLSRLIDDLKRQLDAAWPAARHSSGVKKRAATKRKKTTARKVRTNGRG
jgi:hypothetical protein